MVGSEAFMFIGVSAKYGRSSSSADNQNRRGPWQNINLPFKQTATSSSSSLSAYPTRDCHSLPCSPSLSLHHLPLSLASSSSTSFIFSFNPFTSAVSSFPASALLFGCVLTSKLIWSGLGWIPQDCSRTHVYMWLHQIISSIGCSPKALQNVLASLSSLFWFYSPTHVLFWVNQPQFPPHHCFLAIKDKTPTVHHLPSSE